NLSSSRSFSETAEPLCEDIELIRSHRLEGEAYHVMFVFQNDLPHNETTWYKTDSKIEYISSDKKNRVHYHGGELFFLNLQPEDSGLYTDFNLLQGNNNLPTLWVKDADKNKEGIYTCMCTWPYNHKMYNSSGSRKLKVLGEIMEDRTKNIISTAVLTIDKVSAKDFLNNFECIADCYYERNTANLTLKRRGQLWLHMQYLLAEIIVGFNKIDARLYDAYVVYQMQSTDKVTEETLSQFVTQILPSVLEKKCGYRLFIHGRDDIPGEDRLELVEDSIEQSRRLMVVLTPGSGSKPEITDQCPASTQNSVIGGFDWQVGIHHALVQREMSVILIQLGDTGPQGYTDLPVGLQHLIRKSAPLKWPNGSRGAAAWNSRFWKRVRYLMPATPARKCSPSAII
uniref:TIR domain-containing protein n=1 Tax=Seriola lalandi dorsalis TaxID=1841481 RepID=A0A3B4WZM0_SERLL